MFKNVIVGVGGTQNGRDAIALAAPGHGLHVLAEQHDGDLLVVGSCSRSVAGQAMLGNDTRAALNGALCAVAIAARGYAQKMPIARMGVAYNRSRESDSALGSTNNFLERRAGCSLLVPTRSPAFPAGRRSRALRRPNAAENAVWRTQNYGERQLHWRR